MPDPQRLDVLALAAHPDDVELCAGGTICRLTRQGYRVGIVDFTRGELGSRGTPEGRLEEARAAAGILGLAVRENLGLPDGNIAPTPENRERVIRVLRRYRPHILLVNPPVCRHPDHGAAARLAIEAAFYAGLRKIVTREDDGTAQEPWRPHHILHYMQAVPFEPTFVVDVSDVWEQRTRALQAFRSQFFNPDYEPAGDEPETFVSNPEFFRWIEARARTYGYQIGATYGEPFLYHGGPVGVTDLVGVLRREKPFR
ncbi:bacillithiol biosynthesis deacetylase BshB1 [Rhodocaloribacter litoris]|uniref:bacillithiol biosynthesis deacetylase BshB1 n=1 Tax=Rhodocaloribacter litoris TaxID=2558931 RepID=UPI001E4586F2|nr:bacillithiol biosynthesis deacetylase BshB1 [Rhodocaloribacter litoris]